MARGAALALAAVALTVAGFLIGPRLAGPHTEQTEVGRVSFEVRPSLGGEVDLYVPVADWGLRADAIDAPFSLHAELRTLDRAALLEAAEGAPTLLERVESDLAAGARGAVLRALIWGTGVTAALCALALAVWRPRRRLPLAAATGAATLLVIALAVVVAPATFRGEALERPTYYAGGDELERILALASAEPIETGYGSELDNVLRGISAVLTDTEPAQTRTRDLILGSDLHANVLVVEPLARYLRGAPLLLAGDFGQRGTPAETRVIVPAVAALSAATYAVSGNHDSAALMRELAAAGVGVLGQGGVLQPDGEYVPPAVIDVDGLRIAGFRDPLELGAPPERRRRATTFENLEDGGERFRAAVDELRRWLAGLDPAPDLLVLHQNGLAQALAAQLLAEGYRRPLTIATGHDHRQHVDRYGPVTVVDGGTIGAGGVFDAGEEFAGFAELHFDERRPRLLSVDLIAVEPFSGRARASRVVVDELCPGEPRCSFEPPEAEARLPDA